MPVRLPPVTDHASRILLEGIVDYAGLFPPAALAMPGAVRDFAHYRAGGTGWMLGRFVCPANALPLFSQQADPLLPRDAGAIPWRLAVTSSGDIAADLTGIAAFNERHRVCFEECGALVDAYEVRVNNAAELDATDAALPRDLLTYIEVPYAQAAELLPRIAARGRRAKMRTGGVTIDAFPAAADIAAFLQGCLQQELVAKATAGLHHPITGPYRLTYDDQAVSGRMFGFLNVFLAAALLVQGATTAQAAQLISESDASNMWCDEYQASWRSPDGVVVIERATLQRTREQLLVSFGSCSFTEPATEVRALGWTS
jgi:hypothetical protein